MAKFKKGDLVVLKSGGPTMTVDEVAAMGDVKCVWFAGARREDAYFDPETLLIFEPEVETK